MKSIFNATTLSAAGVSADTSLGRAVTMRLNILEMTQGAEEAVLRPKDFGAFDHKLRAALAARIANLNGEFELAEQYIDEAGTFRPIADPKNNGVTYNLGSVLSFMDKVAMNTSNVVADDISRLQEAEVSDADIVRLSELNSFLAYQIRLIVGLRLMRENNS
jgi:uncharacterized protein YciW